MALATDILDTVAEILVDQNKVAYTEAQGYRHLFDAELAVMAVRPDESIRQIDMNLQAGRNQALPAGVWRIRDVLYNRGRTGALADGQNIRLVAKGPIAGLESSLTTGFDPNANAAVVVREVAYDEREPRLFTVYPPMIDMSSWVKLQVESGPTGYETAPNSGLYDPAAETVVSDKHSNALVEWVLYRFLTRKTDLTSANSEADNHYQRFFALLGITVNADTEASIKNRRQQA